MSRKSFFQKTLKELSGLEAFFAYTIHVVICATLEGFTLQTLGVWFLVPLGIPTLTFSQAVGLVIVIRYTSFRTAKLHDVDDENELAWQLFGAEWFRSVWYLFLGYIIYFLVR